MDLYGLKASGKTSPVSRSKFSQKINCTLVSFPASPSVCLSPLVDKPRAPRARRLLLKRQCTPPFAGSPPLWFQPVSSRPPLTASLRPPPATEPPERLSGPRWTLGGLLNTRKCRNTLFIKMQMNNQAISNYTRLNYEPEQEGLMRKVSHRRCTLPLLPS